jgi:hypothetical protein
MSRETSKSKQTRSQLMESLSIPVNLRSAFIRFCRRGIGNDYDRQAHFWDESKLKWGEYAPVEDRSRVFNTMEEMWLKYNK